MTTTTKQIVITVSVLAAAGLGFYLYQNNKKPKKVVPQKATYKGAKKDTRSGLDDKYKSECEKLSTPANFKGTRTDFVMACTANKLVGSVSVFGGFGL
tara:strand:- start:63 stop:356 length:294 start_codon:yes stop_codon:yes gene_type:complete